MPEIATDQEIKTCCATFYQSDIVRLLLGDVFHPGGLALTSYMGETMNLGPGDRVLDVACGRGAPAIYLAERFGCHVTGLDYGPENIIAAEAQAVRSKMSHRTRFRGGDAEGLPFDDGTFDALISECSFCTFPDKDAVALEMSRVLVKGGRLSLADMTVCGPLPEEMQNLLAWVACVAGAGTVEGYVTVLRAAGFHGFSVEDRRDALLELVNAVRLKLMGAELLVGLSKLDDPAEISGALDNLNLSEAKHLARRAVELIEDGTFGYALITAHRS